jgi:hypothetical protein
MSTSQPGISEANWPLMPASNRTLILALRQMIQSLTQQNEELCVQFTALAAELASLRDRIGCSSRHSSKPPSSDGTGFEPS